MPARLRPTAPIAADAILVGDPGRAMLLAQLLLASPKMSNHARGLWGYGGATEDGLHLTVQATGMGGPSAAVVLADLAELGVERAVRVGTCAAARPGAARPGELLLVERAGARGGSAATFGLAAGGDATPDPILMAELRASLGAGGRAAAVASLDSLTDGTAALPDGVVAADMQTAALLARGAQLGVAVGAVLIVAEADGGRLADDDLERAAETAGQAALRALAKLRAGI